MATWPNVNNTNISTQNDEIIVYQNGINYVQNLGTFSAAVDQGQWVPTFDYEVNTVVRGSDGKRYISIQESGPNKGGAQDPTATPLYWFDCTGIFKSRQATQKEVLDGDDVDAYVPPDLLQQKLNGLDTRYIGEPFVIFDHLAGSQTPENNGTAKYIKLTAGEDGAGGFNEGLLINETTTGIGPTVEITAEIATGPMAGEIVNLVNSENRHIAPGENSGATHNDQMQQITGEIHFNYDLTDELFAGAIRPTESDPEDYIISNAGISPSDTDGFKFDSALSPNARTGDKTDVKRIEATAYMRIV